MASHFGDSVCKHNTDVILKEEVVSGPESSQQLEPEILNCASQLSLYKRFEACNIQDEDDGILEERILSKELPNVELNNTIKLGTVGRDPQNISGTMDMNAKRTSGEWSAVEDGSTDGSRVSESSKKRSRLLKDEQISDGDLVFSSQEKVNTDMKTLDNQEDSLQQSDESKDPPEDGVYETPFELVPTHQVVGEGKNLSESESSKVDPTAGTPGTTPKLSRRPAKRKEKVDHSSKVEKEPSLDNEEDLYRCEEEIQKDKNQKVPFFNEQASTGDHKLGVGPEMDIVEYSHKEWRGKTTVAKVMKEGYEEVSHCFGSIRRVRGDNYCALRATLFQALSQTTKLPAWLHNEGLSQLPEKLVKKYDWIQHWKFWQTYGSKKVWVQLQEYLELFKKKWVELSDMKNPEERQAVCDEIFRNEEEEYCLYEAVKFLMLITAIDLYNANEEGKEVPVFSWLLFARNTSSTPCEFMKNHLNQVGHTGGLEQVEMFLLGYALQHTIKVYRLYKYPTDEFITLYPNDAVDWPVVTLITEDDRHYNVPVRVCEETSL
ncbi:ubiquitin thioesterase otulin [Discoglossus pictus]